MDEKNRAVYGDAAYRRLVENGLFYGFMDMRNPVPTVNPKTGKKLTSEQVVDYLARKNNAISYALDMRNPGAMGCVRELLVADLVSKKTDVARAGKTDVYVTFKDESGAVRRIACESKTGGGELDGILSSAKNSHYIIYSNFVALQSTIKWAQSRRAHLQPVIIPRNIFLALLHKGGRRDDKRDSKRAALKTAIEPSNKTFNLFLARYGVPYDSDRIYTEADFAGLMELLENFSVNRNDDVTGAKNWF